MGRASLLIVEDDPCFGRTMLRELRLGGAARLVPTLADARASLAAGTPHLLVVGVGLPDGCGFDLVEQPPPIGLPGGGSPQVLFCTKEGSSALCARAVKAGAYYLEKAPDGEPRFFFDAVRALHALSCAAARPRLAIDEPSRDEPGTEEWKQIAAQDLVAAEAITDRQRETLQLIASGLCVRDELASEMGLTVDGLRAHLEPLFGVFERRAGERSVLKIQNVILDHALYLAVTRRRR